MKKLKKIVSLVVVFAMIFTLAACSSTETSEPAEPVEKEPVQQTEPEPEAEPVKGNLTPGTYNGEFQGMGGIVPVEVIVDENEIKEINVLDNYETPGVGSFVIDTLPKQIIEGQTLAIDAISGATLTSNAILASVEDCLKQAGAQIKAYKASDEVKEEYPSEMSADVIIVGGGGAGLSAAVAATDEGSSVIVIEKMGFLGGNTIVCGGIYNTPDPELQEAQGIEDSVDLFVQQTYEGGDKVANLDLVKTLCGNAYDGLKWIEDMGMEFDEKIIQGAGSLYPRTHQSVKPLGTGFIDAYTSTLDERADQCEILMNTKGDSLIMDGDNVVGVKATNKDGSELTLTANKGVILATGGFAGNVELRQEFNTSGKWDDLGEDILTTNMPGITGDGIDMAREAGADLVDMEHIQLLYLSIPGNGSISGLYNLGAENTVFVNKEGNRFVREDGRRDLICKSILEQTDGLMYMLYSSDTLPDLSKAKTLEGVPMTDMIENNTYGWVMGETLEDLAEKLDMPAENLVASLENYNASVDSQEDEFDRELLTKKFENGPWYAVPRVPAAHHTMGGVKIDTECHVLNADGEIINGLYCAGELTGGIHGANRLGGNAVVDTVVFGRIAGTSAAKGE